MEVQERTSSTDAARDLRRAVRVLWSAPSVVGIGIGQTVGRVLAAAVVLFLFERAKSPTGSLPFSPDGPIPIESVGPAAERFVRLSPPVVSLALFVPLGVVLLDLAWIGLELPVAVAVAERFGVDDALVGWAAWKRALSRVEAEYDWTTLLAGGVVVRAVGVLGFVVAVALYMVLGTALEATGYALGLYAATPAAVSVLGIGVGGVLLGRWFAAVLTPGTDLAVGTQDHGIVAATTRSIARLTRSPARTIVARSPSAVPAAVAGVVAVGLVAAGTAPKVALLASLVAFAATGPVSYAVAHAAGHVSRSRTDLPPGFETDSHTVSVFGSRDARRRVLTAVILLVPLAAGGAGLRLADAHPAGTTPDAPGPVTTDGSPEAVADAALRATLERSHEQVVVDHHGNETGMGRDESTTLLRYDRADGRVLVGREDYAANRSVVQGVYAGPEVVRFSGAVPDRSDSPSASLRAVRTNDAAWADPDSSTIGYQESAVAYRYPDATDPSTPIANTLVGVRTYELVESEWHNGSIARDGDRVVVTLSDRVDTSGKERIRVVIDADTGYVTRVEQPFPFSDRLVVRKFRNVGDTEVGYPEAASKTLPARVIDLLYY